MLGSGQLFPTVPLTSNRGPQLRESQGNGTFLVVVNSTDPEFLQVPRILFSALAHFGMPYRVWDLSRAPLRAEQLLRHRGLIIGQEHLGKRLRTSLGEIIRAVESGLGMVNLDHDLQDYPREYLDWLGITLLKPAILATTSVSIVDTSAYLTFTRQQGETVCFKRPVPACAAKATSPQPVLLTNGCPALVTGKHGAGRCLQWLVSPKLWLPEVLGHARGLDDLLWKGIVWAARKPFLMKAMPPFVRMRLDDCRGYWRDGHDFDFVDVLNEFGHIPNLGLCLRAVTPDGGRRIKQLFDEQRAEFSPHTLAPEVSLFYGDDAGEYSTDQFHDLMKEMDGLLASWGIRASRVLSDHNHMWSTRVIPFLLERGITFKMNVTCPGETWEGVHVDWQPAPYGQMEYVFDTVPGHPEFFVAFNHFPTLEAARFALGGGRFLFNKEGGFGEVKWDFLNGLTRTTLGHNDLASMARRFADHLRLGLDSLFFGGVISHTHFLKDLSTGDLREVLRQAEALTPRHSKRYASYEHIAEYAQSHVETHLSHVEVSADMGISVRLVGRATVPLELSVFTNVDDGVERRFESVGDCDGVREAVLR